MVNAVTYLIFREPRVHRIASDLLPPPGPPLLLRGATLSVHRPPRVATGLLELAQHQREPPDVLGGEGVVRRVRHDGECCVLEGGLVLGGGLEEDAGHPGEVAQGRVDGGKVWVGGGVEQGAERTDLALAPRDGFREVENLPAQGVRHGLRGLTPPNGSQQALCFAFARITVICKKKLKLINNL